MITIARPVSSTRVVARCFPSGDQAGKPYPPIPASEMSTGIPGGIDERDRGAVAGQEGDRAGGGEATDRRRRRGGGRRGAFDLRARSGGGGQCGEARFGRRGRRGRSRGAGGGHHDGRDQRRCDRPSSPQRGSRHQDTIRARVRGGSNPTSRSWGDLLRLLGSTICSGKRADGSHQGHHLDPTRASQNLSRTQESRRHESPALPGVAGLVRQQATGSTGMRRGPLAGAAKNVAIRTVGASVRLTAEWT